VIAYDFLVAVSAKDYFIGIVNKILNCHVTVNYVWPLDRATVALQRPYQVAKCGGGSLERLAVRLSTSIAAWGSRLRSGGNLANPRGVCSSSAWHGGHACPTTACFRPGER
jgi:hypothetical protein